MRKSKSHFGWEIALEEPNQVNKKHQILYYRHDLVKFMNIFTILEDIIHFQWKIYISLDTIQSIKCMSC